MPDRPITPILDRVIVPSDMKALSDRERWQQMSDAARSWAQAQGTWEKSEAQLFELYRAIAPPTE